MQVIKLTKDSESNRRIAQRTAQSIQQGKLIIYPTDTVYGMAANATNNQAVDALRSFKGQRGTKPISVAVRDQAMAENIASLNIEAKNLYSKFLPGPLTIISSVARGPSSKLAQGITSPENTVGIRIIPHPFVTQLFMFLDFPITATSANISNRPNPRSLEQWLEKTPAKKQALVDCFIDAGELPYTEPSTIIDTSQEDAKIVRQGSLDASQLVSRRSSLIHSFVSHSPEETKTIAHEFSDKSLLSPVVHKGPPVIIALQGPLGAGKTVFAGGLAQALGITEPVRSPTYTLVKEYIVPAHRRSSLDRRRSFYHIDAWRLSSPEEFHVIGLDKMLKPGNIIVIEWPQRLSELISIHAKAAKIILVSIEVQSSKRIIMISS